MEYIGILLTAIGMLASVVVFLCVMAVRTGRIMQTIDDLEKRTKEDREHDRAKFAELYQFKNDTSALLSEINVSLQFLTSNINEIKIELKDIKSSLIR